MSRFLDNHIGFHLGYNYGAKVEVQNCIFANNGKDILDQARDAPGIMAKVDQMEKNSKAKHGKTLAMPGVESVKEVHRSSHSHP
eukprot:6479250-Amphidinium_carterae.2